MSYFSGDDDGGPWRSSGVRLFVLSWMTFGRSLKELFMNLRVVLLRFMGNMFSSRRKFRSVFTGSQVAR